MISNNTKKISYTVNDGAEKFSFVNLYSLPTTCPICFIPQDPEVNKIQFKDENDMANIIFKCINKICESTFSATYLKDMYGRELYHFISFYRDI